MPYMTCGAVPLRESKDVNHVFKIMFMPNASLYIWQAYPLSGVLEVAWKGRDTPFEGVWRPGPLVDTFGWRRNMMGGNRELDWGKQRSSVTLGGNVMALTAALLCGNDVPSHDAAYIIISQFLQV